MLNQNDQMAFKILRMDSGQSVRRILNEAAIHDAVVYHEHDDLNNIRPFSVTRVTEPVTGPFISFRNFATMKAPATRKLVFVGDDKPAYILTRVEVGSFVFCDWLDERVARKYYRPNAELDAIVRNSFPEGTAFSFRFYSFFPHSFEMWLEAAVENSAYVHYSSRPSAIPAHVYSVERCEDAGTLAIIDASRFGNAQHLEEFAVSVYGVVKYKLTRKPVSDNTTYMMWNDWAHLRHRLIKENKAKAKADRLNAAKEPTVDNERAVRPSTDSETKND